LRDRNLFNNLSLVSNSNQQEEEPLLRSTYALLPCLMIL
jgi:hypothetical protein